MRQAGKICGTGHDALCLTDVCWIYTIGALREIPSGKVVMS